MALEESFVLHTQLGRPGDPGKPGASGGKEKTPREDHPSEGQLEARSQEQPPGREPEIEGLTAAGHRALLCGRRKQALSCFRRALALSSETPGSATRRACAFNLGAAYVEAGKPGKGLSLLLECQPAEGEAEGHHAGDLLFNVGAAHEGLGDFGQALAAFRKAQGLYRAARVEGEAGTQMRMGRCHLGMGDPAGAARCFLEAGRVYASSERLEEGAKALSEAARLMLRSPGCEDGQVVAVLNECRQLCERIPGSPSLGRLHAAVGLCFSQLGIFSLAAESFERAHAFAPTEGGPGATKAEAALLQNLGAAHNALGHFGPAVGFHQRAAVLHGSLGDRAAQGQCFGNLAHAFSHLGKHEAAGENYLHALQAFKDAGDFQGQWQACEGLGATHLLLGDPEKAASCYKEALALTSKCPDISEAEQERVVNKLAEALQSTLSVSSRLGRAGGTLPAAPTHRFPTSQTLGAAHFTTASLRGKKETVPPPAACRASEWSAGQRSHGAQATEGPPTLAAWSDGPLQWGRTGEAQSGGLNRRQPGRGVSAAAANEISALGVPNGQAVAFSEGAGEGTQMVVALPAQIPGNRPAVGCRLPHHCPNTSQQGWRSKFKSAVCSLM